ncbi:MAG: serine protease, partial [Planctomycetales bacterium]
MTVAEIVDAFDDAVVFITSEDALGNKNGVGSGCVISKEGLVATNFHVLRGAAKGYVQFREGKEKHEIAGYRASDADHDLCLIQLKTVPENIAAFEIDESEHRQGEELIAIGHPLEFDFTVSEGIVSALRTTEQLPEIYQMGLHANPKTQWIQTTAAIDRGSSGGPLLSRQGKLVGLNTWFAEGRSLSFAIHARHMKELWETMHAETQPLPLPGTEVVADPEVAQVVLDFQKEYGVLVNNMRAALPKEQVEILAKQNPLPIYLPRFLELAETKQGTPAEFEALISACRVLRSRLRVSESLVKQV